MLSIWTRFSVWSSSWSRNYECFSCLRRSNRKPFEFLNSWIPEFLNSWILLITDLNLKLWSAFSITVYDISLKLTAGRADINECILKLHLARRKPNWHCSSTSRILVHYQRLSFLWCQVFLRILTRVIIQLPKTFGLIILLVPFKFTCSITGCWSRFEILFVQQQWMVKGGEPMTQAPEA